MDKKASRLSRMRKDVGVQRETRSTPITALVLRLRKAIPKPSTSVPRWLRCFRGRESLGRHAQIGPGGADTDGPAQAVSVHANLSKVDMHNSRVTKYMPGDRIC